MINQRTLAVMTPDLDEIHCWGMSKKLHVILLTRRESKIFLGVYLHMYTQTPPHTPWLHSVFNHSSPKSLLCVTWVSWEVLKGQWPTPKTGMNGKAPVYTVKTSKYTNRHKKKSPFCVNTEITGCELSCDHNRIIYMVRVWASPGFCCAEHLLGDTMFVAVGSDI